MITRSGLVLLGVAALATGCPADDDGGGGGSSGDGGSSGGTGSSTLATSSASTSGTVTSSTTENPSDTSSSTTEIGTTTDPSTTSSTTSETTGSSSGSGSSDESTGNGAEVCMSGCQVEVDCGFCATKWKSVEACVDWCLGNLVEAGMFSLACRSAWADMHECVGTLTCDEFPSWCAKDPPFEYPCVTADQALSFECAGQ